MSSGQKRRLTIALILSLNPKILVLDEVTVGSDYLTKLQVWEAIKKVNTTNVIITHDMGEVKEHGNRIVLVKKGVGRELKDVRIKCSHAR